MAEASRSSGKKRARDDEDSDLHPNGGTEDSVSLGHSSGEKLQITYKGGVTTTQPRPRVLDAAVLELELTFSDTLIALQMMRAQFPKVDKVSIQPFILRSQLYSSVKDRTQVDRDLESLKKERVLRIFKLNTGQDDHAILFMDDYLEQMAIAVKWLEARPQQYTEVFEWFKRYVIESNLDVCIEHQQLCTLLSIGGDVQDKHLTLLINAGLLTSQLIDPNVYWFAIPNVGPILKGLSQERDEVLACQSTDKHQRAGPLFTQLLLKMWCHRSLEDTYSR